jgi:hypothetical protein
MALISDQEQFALAMLMVTGSVVCLIGSLAGKRYFLPSARDDVRIGYWFMVFGQLSVILSLSFYLYITLKFSPDLVTTLSGSLTLMINLGLVQSTANAIKEIRRVDKLDRQVIAQMKERET